MFLRWNKRKGQSVSEYAIISGALIAGAMAMQGYSRRAMEGRIQTEMDKFSGGAGQYEQMRSSYTGESEVTKKVNSSIGGGSFDQKEENTRKGSENY